MACVSMHNFKLGRLEFVDRTPGASSMRALGVWSSYKGRTVDA